MRHLALLMATTVAMVIPRPGAAQDYCRDILSNGIWQTESSASATQNASAFLSSFCSRENKSVSKAQDISATIGLPLPELPLDIGGSYGATQGETYLKEMCRFESGQFKHAAQFSAFSQKASEVIANAWSQCMANFNAPFVVSTTLRSDPRQFLLRMRYKSITPAIPTVAVKPSFSVSTPGEPVRSPNPEEVCVGMSSNIELAQELSFVCNRPSEHTTITASFNITPQITGAAPDIEVVGLPPPPICRPENRSGSFDLIVCSGVNCGLPHIRDGERKRDWQVVQWFENRERTRNLSRVVSWPPEFSDMRANAKPEDLSLDFYIADNAEQAQFFDMNDPKRSYFEFAGDARQGFRFVNNYENQPNHHIRVRVTAQYPAVSCR